EPDQDAPTIVPWFREIGRERECLVISCKCFRQTIERLHDGAPVVERLDVIWLQRQRTIETRKCLIVLPENAKRRAAIIVCVGIVLFQNKGLVEAFESFFVATEIR